MPSHEKDFDETKNYVIFHPELKKLHSGKILLFGCKYSFVLYTVSRQLRIVDEKHSSDGKM